MLHAIHAFARSLGDYAEVLRRECSKDYNGLDAYGRLHIYMAPLKEPHGL